MLECCLELLGEGLLVSLQDLGAAGLTSSAAEMASSGGVGIDIDVARVPLREADMEPFEIMVSESQERMLAVVEPAEVDRVLALCEKWETGVGGRRRGHRRRAVPGPARRRGGRRDAGRRARRRVPAVRPGARPSPRAGSYAANARRSSLVLGARDDAGDDVCSSCLASPEHRQQALGVRAVRLGRALAHGPPARGRRRRRPAPARGRRDDRGRDRRQRPPGRLRPLRGHGRGGARVRPEPRLRRRRAARPHQLPQLRQPREAGGRLAARPLDPGPRRRLRGARRARSSAATSRSTTRPRTDRSTRPRWSAWSASCPTPSAPAAWRSPTGRRDRGLRPVLALARRLGAGEAARRARPRPAVAADRPASTAAIDAVREAVRGGRAWRAAHDVSDGGLACALAEMAIAGGVGLEADLDGLVEARGCSGETALFGEGPGGFVLAGDRAALEAPGRRPGSTLFVIGRAGGERISISAAEAEVEVALADAERAWRSLGERHRAGHATRNERPRRQTRGHATRARSPSPASGALIGLPALVLQRWVAETRFAAIVLVLAVVRDRRRSGWWSSCWRRREPAAAGRGRLRG